MDQVLTYLDKYLVSTLDAVEAEAKHSSMTEDERRDCQALQRHFTDTHIRKLPDDQPNVTIGLFKTCLFYLARKGVPYYAKRFERFEELCSYLPE